MSEASETFQRFIARFMTNFTQWWEVMAWSSGGF